MLRLLLQKKLMGSTRAAGLNITKPHLRQHCRSSNYVKINNTPTFTQTRLYRKITPDY